VQELTRLSIRAVLAAAICAAAPAWSVSLGEVEVRSALGEPLDARVPLTLSPGETVDATCFGLARDTEPGVPVLTEGLLTVDRVADRTELRIRSSGAIFEPAMRIRVRAGCPGQPGEALRQYSMLLDPRHGDPVVANVPAVTASLDARPGDTLEGIATKIFPHNRAARDRYLQSMREVNPALASLGNTDPVPAGASVALPDLRTFARGAGTPVATAQAPRAAEPTAESTPAPHAKAARRKPRTERQEAAAPRNEPRTAAARAPSNEFVLKLSGDSVDLSRTREVDERTRAQLRERLMILESDDQVAAVLALRNRLNQLEQRVNELQLKLAQMPASFPERPATQPSTPPTAQPATPPTAQTVTPPDAQPTPPAASQAATPPAVQPVTPPTIEAPKPPVIAEAPSAPPVAEAPTTSAPATTPEPAKEATQETKETAPASETKNEPAKSESAKSESSSAAAAAATPSTSTGATAPGAKPVMAGAKPDSFAQLRSLLQAYGLWALFIAVLALMMLLGWRLTHRAAPEYESDEEAWEQPPPTEPRTAGAGEETYDPEKTQALAAPDAPALRRRYIEERFPEVSAGTLSLDDPASVVKSARLLYEDGAMPRAVELLHFAIEENPGEVRPWLALFEIHRLERLTGEFAELARRFYERFGNTEYWRKVRYFGREIDPGNLMYREDVDALETIGPGTRKEAERFDPAHENWLDAPMDFENQVLANELRRALMGVAGIVDQDLVPNPMPALRDAEMFTVA
jgi:hypothetical protein